MCHSVCVCVVVLGGGGRGDIPTSATRVQTHIALSQGGEASQSPHSLVWGVPASGVSPCLTLLLCLYDHVMLVIRLTTTTGIGTLKAGTFLADRWGQRDAQYIH